MLRLQVIWTGVGLGNSYTNLHFDGDSQSAADLAGERVENWLIAMTSLLSSNVQHQLQPEVLNITPANGNTTDVFIIDGYTQTGGGGAARVPDGAQGLVRLLTNSFRGARRIKGRINIPGMTANVAENGGLSLSAQADLQAAADTHLVTPSSGADLQVYSRPSTLLPTGLAATVEAATVWSEFAHLSSRRS